MASPERKRRSGDDLKRFMAEARARFKQCEEANAKQARRELDDLAFYAGGDHQWDPDQLKARKAQQGSGGANPMPPVPARPVITINKMPEPVNIVLNEERLSDMAPQLVPADDFEELVGALDDTEIELREGIVRRIQRAAEAAAARSWAFKRAVIAGTGYYVVLTRYVEGKTFDQEVYVHKLYNQASVGLDPAHEQSDGSDAEWGFIGENLTGADYDARYPWRKGEKNALRVSTMSDAEWRMLGDDPPSWFYTEGEGKEKRRMVRVTHYWYLERETRELVQLADGTTAWDDELPEGTPDDVIIDRRAVVTKTMKWALLDGIEPLEEEDWPSSDMPIVKVLGEELQPFDKERRVQGMVRPARGGQMGFNAMVSKLVETIGLAPIPPFQVAEGQVTGWESWYQVANTRTLPFLPYRAFDASGRPLGPPTRTPIETPIQAMAGAVQMFDEAIKSTTMVPSVQLGQATDSHLKSGRAIKLMQDQAQLGTSNYIDNLKASVRREGQIINNMLYSVYGQRPGRFLRLMTGEGEQKTVRLAEPPPTSDQDGAPTLQVGASRWPLDQQPLPGQQPPQTSPISGARQQGPKQWRLTEHANFNVEIKVSKNTATRRDAAAQFYGSLVEANPMFMTWFGDLALKYRDDPGAKEASERVEVMLDPKIQAFLEEKKQDSGSQVPPEAQAKMAQMQQQLQHAEQILQQAKQEIEGKHAEQQAKMQIAQMETDRALQLQAMKDATTLEVARITAARATFDARLAAIEESLALQRQIEHDATDSRAGRTHETLMKAADIAHAQDLQDAEQQHALDIADSQHAHEQEMGARQQPAELAAPIGEEPTNG